MLNSDKLIKVAIVDDHKLFRAGVALILNEIDTVSIQFEASDGNELLDKLNTEEVDVILLDVEMPGMSGEEVLKLLRTERPELKVIMLTMFHNEEYMVHFMKLGAKAYLLKDTTPDELEHAIVTVMEKGSYLSAEVSKAVLNQLSSPKSNARPNFDNSSNLSEREIEVLRLICKEHTSQEIADELFLSIRTIETYRKRLLEKTGARNSVGLVRYAVENGIDWVNT